MPVKIGVTQEQTLINAALPPATSTYTVISHKFVIDTIRKQLTDNGFEIESEEFRCNSGANVAVGTFKMIYGNDPDLKLTYTFSNSYDKSLRFRAAIGACVNISGGYIISDVNNWRRKHTGTADTETEDLIKEHIQNASLYFDQLVADKELMKNITVDISTFGGMLGELFIKGYLAIDQLSVIKKEFEKPSFQFTTPADSLWTLYNHILYALTTTHPSKWMTNHVAIHLYLVSRFNLINFDDDSDLPEPFQNVKEEEVTVDSIEEVDEKQPDYLSGDQAENMVKEHNQIDMFEELDNNVEEVTEEIEAPNMEELGQNVFAFDETDEDLDDDGLEELDTQEAVEDKAPETIEEAVEETIIESIIEQSVEVAKEVQEIVNQAVENPSNDTGEEIVEDSEEVYFDCADYEGVEVGDTIEEENVYYDLIRKENIEGDDYFIGVAITVNDEETLDDHQVEDVLEELEEDTFESFSPVDHARQARAAMSIEELSDEDLADQYGTMNAEEINSAISEEAAIYHSEEETPEVNEDVLNEEYNDDVESVLEQLEEISNDKVKVALASEIENLYGQNYEFTYQDLGNQYSVTLETGEVANFSKSWIETQMNEDL